MTKEELIKNQFPNDEFLQSAVSLIVDKCIAELKKENAELKSELTKKADTNHSLVEKMADLEIENAKLKRIVKMVAMINKGVYSNEGIEAIYTEAEQFLKEVNEK